MIVKDEKGKLHVLKCKVCGADNKPLIGGEPKNLYCEQCHQKIIEQQKAKVKERFVLRDEPVKKQTTKKK